MAMRCPICDFDLLPSEREGIDIDCCPQCKGVWLDQGKLERIIERSNPVDWDWQRNDDADDLRSPTDIYW